MSDRTYQLLKQYDKIQKKGGQETIEEPFKQTVTPSAKNNQLKEKDFEHLNVDTIVLEKAISFQTDSKLYYKMLEELVIQAQKRV